MLNTQHLSFFHLFLHQNENFLLFFSKWGDVYKVVGSIPAQGRHQSKKKKQEKLILKLGLLPGVPYHPTLTLSFLSFQLDHPAVHRAGCSFRLRPDWQPPSSAGARGAAGSAEHGEQRKQPIPVHGALSGHQGVGVQAAAAVLLSAAGREPPSGFLQHLAALQRLLLCKRQVLLYRPGVKHGVRCLRFPLCEP